MSDIYQETLDLANQLQSIVARPATQQLPPYHTFAKTLMNQTPELITPTPDEITVEDISLPEPVHTTQLDTQAIGFELWEALAYDLALNHADEPTILGEYNITGRQLAHLKENKYFDKMLQAKKDEIAQLGSQSADVAFTVKMRMLANRATPEFLKRLTSPATANKDFLNMFKLTVDLAQLAPREEGDVSPTPVIGASVVFNIGGVPGLEHLNVKTTVSEPSKIIDDAEFTEVADNFDLEEL